MNRIDALALVENLWEDVLEELRLIAWLNGHHYEDDVTREVFERLERRSYEVITRPRDRRYPRSLETFDRGVWLGDHPIRSEVKMAWLDWPAARGRPNPVFHKHLLSPTENSAFRDLTVKLPQWIGFGGFISELLVTFHSNRRPAYRHLARLILAAGVDSKPWRIVEDEWANPDDPNFLVSATIIWRSAE